MWKINYIKWEQIMQAWTERQRFSLHGWLWLQDQEMVPAPNTLNIPLENLQISSEA